MSPRRPGPPPRSGPARRGGPRPAPTSEGFGLGATQVEGRQAVRELLSAGRRAVRQVYIAEGAEPSGALEEIAGLASAAGVPLRRVGRERIQAMAASEAPQGVLAHAEPLPEIELDDLLRVSHPFLVVLDGVTDPHNLGAVMRSALCAGASGLVVGRHRSASLSPAAVKAAAGAVEYLPVAAVPGVPGALSALREAGVWTVGLDADGREPIWGLQVASEPVALVLGAEGRGISVLARSRCDVVASIPLAGPLESLNVSAAAAIACFEVARLRAALTN